jgi:hypothetical protein
VHLIIVSVVNVLVVAIAVLIHYEFLYRLTRLLPRIKIRHRLRIVIGVAGALLAHVVEIWLFAATYYLMVTSLQWGTFNGAHTGLLVDCFYFSFTTYTTLGFGDIQPIGDIRYLAGVESLTGLVLITWTASFLYIEMQNYWNKG